MKKTEKMTFDEQVHLGLSISEIEELKRLIGRKLTRRKGGQRDGIGEQADGADSYFSNR